MLYGTYCLIGRQDISLRHQRILFGADGGTTGIDDDFAARGFKNVGAWILGRNMFGPIRGSWPGRATRPTEWMCALAADLTLSSNIFVRASSMSCTSLSRRSRWAGESDRSRGLTCALWDTNAFSSLRRRKPPMLYSGAKGTMTRNNRLQRTALPRRR
jgi:hypothetical protein